MKRKGQRAIHKERALRIQALLRDRYHLAPKAAAMSVRWVDERLAALSDEDIAASLIERQDFERSAIAKETYS